VAKFSISYTGFATTTSAKTAAKVIGASAKQFEVVEIGMYGDGRTTPADSQHEAQFAFLSNAGAGTAGASPTPEKASQGSNVSGVTAGTSYSAEPTTYATNILTLFAFNQRGGMRWAVPANEGFRTDGSQTNLSAGVRVISSVAGVVAGNVLWVE